MPAATSIICERATGGDAAAISSLLKRSFGYETIPDHKIIGEVKDLITKQHCVFDVAIDPQLEGRVFVGVALWFFHIPKDWSGDKKGLLDSLFGPTSSEPKDFRGCDCGADPASSLDRLLEERVKALRVVWPQEFNEPLLFIDKVCVEIDSRNQRIAESLLKHTFRWAVLHDVKVILAVEIGVAGKLVSRLQKVLPDVMERRYATVSSNIEGVQEGHPYGMFVSRYGVNKPYPEEVKEAAKYWETP